MILFSNFLDEAVIQNWQIGHEIFNTDTVGAVMYKNQIILKHNLNEVTQIA